MTDILYAIFILFYLVIFVYFVYTFYALISGAPFVPTSREHVKQMLKIANLKPNDILMDLGSGDGRILLLASDNCQKCLGIEINPLLCWWSKIKAKLKNKNNIEILRQDLWKTDLSNVNILTLFFIAPKMDKLHKKIINEMKPGSRVVSYGFTFPNWQYTERHDKIYLYQV